MASHIVGYPCMGPKRELKFALESFWDGKSSAEDLEKVATDLRSSIWKQMSEAGIKYIPSNTFSYYDQVLDTTAMLGAVPERYSWTGGKIGLSTYFSMARGNASIPAMEMTNWFDTNKHFIVPELGPSTKFTYASYKAVSEYKEAKALGIDTVPVLFGPVSYLLLSKPAKGVEKSFSLLSLLGSILPIYKEVVAELKAAGASWIQFDEPTLVKDLDAHELAAFSSAYAELESAFSGLNVLIETYFADIPAESYKTLTSLSGVTAYGFDLIRGAKTLDLIRRSFPSGKYLFAGIVDGRNFWADDLAASLSTLQSLEAAAGKEKLVVSTSCPLMHTAELNDEIRSCLGLEFAAQKFVEVNALAKALAGQKDEAYFAANAAAQASRISSPQKVAAALKGSDHRHVTTVSARLDAQQRKLKLPEELDIDVLVHGEPEKLLSPELRDWAGLAEDLLHQIIAPLGSFADLPAFAATCHAWSSAFSSYPYKSTLSKLFPPLLLDPNVPFCSPFPFPNVALPKRPCYVIDLANQDTSLCSQIPLLSTGYGNNHLPGALDKFAFRGASFGQMIFSSNKTCFLFDVFTGIRVSPPPLPIDEITEIYDGAALTGPLSSPNCHLIVSTTCSSNFFWRVGSMFWSECSPHNGTITQVVVFKGQAFGMGSDHRLFKLHFNHEIHLEEIEVSWDEINSTTTLHNPWLVVCGDMLLMVGCNSGFPTKGDVFEAYGLDTSTEHSKWLKVDKLENWAIFISNDFRVQPLSCQNPERWGWRSSSVYCYDCAAGHLVSFELGRPLQQDAFIFLQWYKRVPPTWIVPSTFSS